MQDTESQRKKVAVYQAKIDELEQHVGMISNSPDPYFTQNIAVQDNGSNSIANHGSIDENQERFFGGVNT